MRGNLGLIESIAGTSVQYAAKGLVVILVLYCPPLMAGSFGHASLLSDGHTECAAAEC